MKRNKFESTEVLVSASILYYDLEELSRFINMLHEMRRDGFDALDGLFLTFVNYLGKWKDHIESKLAADEDGSLKAMLDDPEKRKESMLQFVRQLSDLEPSSSGRANFEMWLEAVLNKEVDMQLADEAIAKFIWETYCNQIALMDKSDIPFEKRVLAIPSMPDGMRKDKVKKISEIDSSKIFPDVEDDEGAPFSFGVPDFDGKIQFKKGEFGVVAARPGVGKTVIMMKMAMANALRGKKCMFISLEMPEEQMSKRFLNFYAKKNIEGEFMDEMGNLDVSGARKEAERFMAERAYQKMFGNISYFDSSDMDAATLLDFMQKEIKRNHYDAIFIDYLQLMLFSGLDEWQSLRRATRELKKFALRNKVLVISASQVNRASVERGLYLSDLFGSSSIEADTDRVVGLEESTSSERNLDISIVNFKVLKNRHGPKFEERKVINYGTGEIADVDRY